MSRVALIASIPRELRPIVQSWDYESRGPVRLWRNRSAKGERIAACAGSGMEAIGRVLPEIEKVGRLDAVVSLGFAGALLPEFEPGRAYAVGTVIDGRTGQRLRAAGTEGGACLLTLPRVAGREEKGRLAEKWRAGLVDMEGAAVARWAEAKGVPFLCLKGVSDGWRDETGFQPIHPPIRGIPVAELPLFRHGPARVVAGPREARPELQ